MQNVPAADLKEGNFFFLTWSICGHWSPSRHPTSEPLSQRRRSQEPGSCSDCWCLRIIGSFFLSYFAEHCLCQQIIQITFTFTWSSGAPFDCVNLFLMRGQIVHRRVSVHAPDLEGHVVAAGCEEFALWVPLDSVHLVCVALSRVFVKL